MTKNNAELTKLIKDLTEQVKSNKTEYEDQLQSMKTDYERKFAFLEEKLMAVIQADANATLRTVNGFFKNLEDKVGEHTISIDILQGNIASHDATFEGMADKLKTAVQSVKSQGPDANIDDDVVIGQSALSLQSLEERVDGLEDYSRRDNLLFYGFHEQKFEDCREKVIDFICKKLMPGDRLAENIEFVRIHRLGRYKKGATRPIIARFKHYTDRMNVLKGCKNLKDNNPDKFSVSEDFSPNTTEKRRELQKYAKIAKTKLGVRVKGVFVKFKSLAVRRINDTVRTFSLQHVYNLIEDNQSDWWEILFKIVSQQRSINKTDELVDTGAAEGVDDPYPDGDSSPLPEPEVPAVPEPEVSAVPEPEVLAVKEDNVPLNNGDSSPHTVEEDGESS